jgi:selenide,water dikinase
MVEVQSVDFFKSFLDDPYLFGQIAALHAMSDLHAMNATPLSALAIVTLPYASPGVLESQLFELLSGAVKAFRQCGATLSGGHTTEGSELALGFAVCGYAKPESLFRKGQLREGDALVLTKPLGTGALIAASMRAAARAEWSDTLTRGLLQSNAEAARILARLGVKACTDITGFGLAGHLLEMLDASRLSAEVWSHQIPIYPGFTECVEQGISSTLHPENRKFQGRVDAEGEPPACLFDPQTVGGLLCGLPWEKALEAVIELREAGYRQAALIGEVIANEAEGRPRISLRTTRPHLPAGRIVSSSPTFARIQPGRDETVTRSAD